MSVTQTNAADLAKAVASLKGGDELQIHGGGANLSLVPPVTKLPILVSAVDPVAGLAILSSGPVQVTGKLGLGTARQCGLRIDAAKGTLLDVLCDGGLTVDCGDPTKGTGLYFAGPGKTVVRGSHVTNVQTGVSASNNLANGPMTFEADDWHLSGIGNDGFDFAGFADAWVHDGTLASPRFTGQAHQDAIQAWQIGGIPNGSLRVHRNTLATQYQGVYAGLLAGGPALTGKYGHALFEVIDNDITGSTVGGVMAMLVERVVIQGNRFHTNPDGAFQCGIQDASGWLSSCGTVVREGNTIDAWTSPATAPAYPNRAYAGKADKTPWARPAGWGLTQDNAAIRAQLAAALKLASVPELVAQINAALALVA